MATTERRVRATDKPAWSDAAQAMYRAAQVVSQPGGPSLFDELVRELADILQAATVFVAVFCDESRSEMRTLAAVLDGQPMRNFEYPLEGSPCAKVVGQSFRYVARGVAAEFPPGTIFGAKGMDAYAAFPLNDSSGTPLGLLAVMDRRPIADEPLSEALLNIFAGRIVAEIERSRADSALRAAALAVSSAHGESVFAELARYLATILRVEMAFIARHEPGALPDMRMMAVYCDGAWLPEIRYPLQSSPCVHVLGQQFRAYPSRLRELFPDDGDARTLALESYAGFPLNDRQGRALGTLGVLSRRPLAQLGRIESMLQIFAVRAAAELEQLRAREALSRSEASYRAIFESAEDAIFIHDWDSGEVLDVNPKACTTYGYSREELCRIPMADIGAGAAPYTAEQAQAYLQMAKLDRCPPFEWQRRSRDGSLHWDEVRLKPVQINGRPHVLAFTREITEHKAAVAALQAREEQYRAIFDGSADALALWSRDIRLVDVNRAFTQMYGYERDEVVGGGFGQQLSPEDVARRVALIQRALAGEEGVLETHSRRKGGERFEVELRYLPIVYRGEPHALVVGRDITERLERERARHRSEQQYRAIFNASADALVLRDRDFRIVEVNTTYERMSGFTRTEAIGQNRVLANPPEVAGRIAALHARALAGEPVVLETQLVRRDGIRYELELRGVPILHRGEPHVLYIGRDITEGKRAEQALRDSEEQYRAIFNASTDGLVLRDAAYRAVEVNPAYVAMSGYTREEVLAADRVLTQADEAVQRGHRAQHQRILDGELVRFEVEATRKDGGRFHAEVRGMPVMYGGQLHVLYAARDITERHEAEQRRAELERQLRQAQKMEAIGQLTGGIAHDFNNILTSVIGYLVLGHERAETLADATLVRQLGQAQLAAQRARDLIAQMMTFARRQRGDRHVLPLAPLVRQTVQLLRATLPSSIVLDAHEAEAGAEDATPPVRADAVQLEQVLFNLCINARDAMDGAGHIRVGLREADGARLRCASCGLPVGGGSWVELSVADSGSGILPDVQARMFEPFFSTKEVGRGSGMGLAMVHGIVHDHLGHVGVDTRPGHGAVFRILLPAADAPTTRPVPAPSAAGGACGQLAGRVLLVEDEAMVGDFMAELLQGWGLRVVLMRSALAARAWLEDASNALDLLITDQTMPQLTGLALAQRAVSLRPGLPVLLYTGQADTFDAADLQAHGVRALLHKPVDAEALRTKLRRWLDTPRR